MWAAFVSPAAAAVRTLELGMSGSDVTAAQQALIKGGYLSGSATGYFGQLTLAAVQKLQCAKAIACDSATQGYGLIGPKTQAALQLALAPKQPTTANVSTAALTAVATGKFEVSGWVPDWRAASGTIDVTPHLGSMTSVMPFGFTMSASGHVLDKAHLDQEPWTSLIAAAKAQGTRVIPTIMWGSGTEIQAVLSDSTKRVALEDEIVALVKARGYDGIDIDFEAKQAGTINYFSTFLKGLYQRMGQKWVYCTVEARMPLEDRYLPGQTIPPDATQYANDYTAMNTYCDRIEIMAYDQGTVDLRLNAARVAPYAPVADPGWVENIVRVAAQTISRNKLVLGLATYGYEYQVTPSPGGYIYQRLWAFNPTYGLKIAAQLGITPARTSANEIGFVYDPARLAAAAPTGNNITETQQSTPTTSVAQNLGGTASAMQTFNYMTWSDAQAIADKVALAHRLGLRGVAVFSLGGAEDQAMWNILK